MKFGLSEKVNSRPLIKPGVINTMATAIITGITGQDGSYMAELLLAKGYKIVGAVRDVERAKERLLGPLLNKVSLVQWDMLDQSRMIDVLKEYCPSEIYNYSAYSSGSGMYDDPVDIGEVNGISITRILEAIRKVNINIRFCQASSSEMFGEANESPQTEKTIFHPRSPYGAAKLYAHSVIDIYRHRYNLFACSAILFNHESPRRSTDFVTRKITHEVAKIKLNLSSELCLGNLDACRDWGFAGDYVYAMWLMLQGKCPDDYVIATGKVHSVRQLCELAFERVALDYRDYVREDTNMFRPNEKMQLVGDAKKARLQMNWEPKIGFRELVNIMIDVDLRLIENKQGKSKCIQK